jgi:tellurite resistance protein TerC
MWIWIAFIGFVVLMLALDLGVFHRNATVISVRQALAWSAVWIGMGLSFAVFVYFAYEGHWFGLGTIVDAVDGAPNDGASATEKYLTGYVLEKSLSVDNIFVIALIFGAFAVPAMYQHKVLFWGILGALFLRGLMIGIGATLIAEFHWILYIFAMFLIITALRMLFIKEQHADPNNSPAVRLLRRLFPVTENFHGGHFAVRAGSPESLESAMPGEPPRPDAVVSNAAKGALLLTPLALALVLVETTDLIFAVDSIPAIFAITSDPFLVYTSNVFAILGLRSLYFALAGMVEKFRYLKLSLVLILLLVGIKMLFAGWLKTALGENFNLYLLAVVISILAFGVFASLVADRNERLAARH